MDLMDPIGGFLMFALVLGVLTVGFAWRVAGLLERRRIAEIVLRERLARWKARVARETAAAREAGRAG